MKAVILAGGFGTRLSEETGVRSKPMMETGGRPTPPGHARVARALRRLYNEPLQPGAVQAPGRERLRLRCEPTRRRPLSEVRND